jgi:aquaporin Z
VVLANGLFLCPFLIGYNKLKIMKNKFFAEMIGTMVLVLMGCGAAVMNGGATSVAAVLTIAFAFGLSVVAMAYTIGSISGCHINPAITIGVWLSGRMGIYILAQVIGGILGSAILWVITGMMGLEGTGANGFDESQLAGALTAEAVFTFIFVLVVLGSTDSKNNTPRFAGLAIGLTLVLVRMYPVDGNFGESGTQYRACIVCGCCRVGAIVGIYRSSPGGGGGSRNCLEGNKSLML